MWFFRKVHKGFRVMDEAEGKMSAVLQENLSGVRVVRAFGQQQREVEKFDAANSDFRQEGETPERFACRIFGAAAMR